MWHRFPQPFRDLILRALEAAPASHVGPAQPRDFLAAIPRVPACSAAQILTRLNALDVAAQVTAAAQPTPAHELSSETKTIFEQAYEESAQLNDRLVGSDHFLLAMLKLNE